MAQETDGPDQPWLPSQPCSPRPVASIDGRTLPWRILGRAVRPYALAVSLACAVI